MCSLKTGQDSLRFVFLQAFVFVKFRIPRNSLFGVLLRSPWWVSMILAVVLAAIFAALIPREYVFIALIGTLPILVIGLVAAWRQWRIPSQEQRAAVLRQSQHSTWAAFSAQLAQAWQAHGIEARDPEAAGVDWHIAREGRDPTLVYARRWKASVHGLEPLRQLAQAMQSQGVERGLYIAAGGTVSPPALRFAREHQIRIWLGDELSLFLLGTLPPEHGAEP